MAKYTNSELCLIWLDSFCGLEYKHKQELYKLINGKEGIHSLLVKGRDYILNYVGESEYNNLLASANETYLSYVLESLATRGIQAVTIQSSDYPDALKETAIPPLVLYAKGDVSLLNSQIFGIVGSRRSLPLSISLAGEYAKELSQAGFTLVTGIAQGVDEKVLKSVLENNGKAISVLGGGFDNIYPKTNEGLVEQLANKGLVITEYPPEVMSKAYHFPVRNRIIAGLSVGVLIVSGRIKSGTQYTAEYAEEYGRDVFSIPYSVGIESGAGCNDLIKRGAILTDRPEDILEFYGKSSAKQEQRLDENEMQIVDALSQGEMHVQQLCSKINRQVYEVLPVLSMLEIKGIVIKNGVNVYGLVRTI